MSIAFLSLNGHPDSITTKAGEVLIEIGSIEAVTSWQGGARIGTKSGIGIYVEESVTRVKQALAEAAELASRNDD